MVNNNRIGFLTAKKVGSVHFIILKDFPVDFAVAIILIQWFGVYIFWWFFLLLSMTAVAVTGEEGRGQEPQGLSQLDFAKERSFSTCYFDLHNGRSKPNDSVGHEPKAGSFR